MTRCYEKYWLVECKPNKCDISSERNKRYMKQYMVFMKGYGVKFDNSPEDKAFFERLRAEHGTEYALIQKRQELAILSADPYEPLQLRLFNTWNFSEAIHGDPEYEWGYNTGHITENLLYYYTKPDDLVIDPMIGSGTTRDACERMGRRCLGYDKEEDIRKGIKLVDDELAQLVFLDPPFYTLLENEFEDYADFKRFVLVAIEKSLKVLRPNGYLALIMMNLSESQDNPKKAMIGDCYALLAAQEELEFENMILCPLSTQRSGTDTAKDNKDLLNNARVVWVFRRVA